MFCGRRGLRPRAFLARRDREKALPPSDWPF
jgi:hypothetical protein